MKKPLLTAKEYELLKEFPTASNLSLLPKILLTTISITKIVEKSVERTQEALDTKLTARLKRHEILNKDPTRPIYYYDFEVKSNALDEFKYEPGDSFGFSPELSQEEVENLSGRLGLDLKELVTITGPKDLLSSFFPRHDLSNCTELIVRIEDILSRIDLRSFPKKAILRTLAEYCSNESDSNLLLFLSSRNGSDAYNRLRGELLSGQIILSAIDSLKCVPIEVLASLFGPLQLRFYSCCRSQKSIGGCSNTESINSPSSGSFQIVFHVSEAAPESSPNLKIKGVCSSWLENLSKSSDLGNPSISFPIKKRSINHFRLPDVISSSRPIIMIASGTGIAPFIGFLEILQQAQNNFNLPFNWLIFGLRSSKTDFIFQKDLEKFLQLGTLSRLSLAQSRDPDTPKTYVQDLLKKEKIEFSHLINEKDAIIYICGDEITMIKGVNDAIVEIIMENQPELNQKEAENLLMNWTKEKKIIRDIWI